MSRNRNRNRNRSNGPRPPQAEDANPVDMVRPFRFRHDGQIYELPPAAVASSRLNAGQFLDAVMDGEAGQLRYFAMILEAADPAPEALAALRSMQLERFGSVMEDWVKRTGAHPGKSAASSH